MPKDNYLMQGFVQVKIGVSPYWIHSLANSTQAKRKQYGMKHHAMITISAAM